MSTLRPLLPTNHLTAIPVSDKPPRLGGTIQKITPAAFKELFGCEFSEAIWGSENDVQAILQNWRAYDHKVSRGRQIEASPRFTAKVLDRLQNPFADFVISRISDVVGYGVFATKDIPRNTAIALYSGDMGPYQTHDSYAFGLGLDTGQSECSLAVSSLQRGGIARFLQHLPKDGEKRRKEVLSRLLDVDYNVKKLAQDGTPVSAQSIALTTIRRRKEFEQAAKTTAASEYDTELDDCIFSTSSVRPQIAVRNVRVKKRIVQGQPLLVLLTLYPIEKGEQLGLSYRNVVSTNARRFPEFFDQKGKVLSHSLYKRVWVELSFKSGIQGYFAQTPRFPFTPAVDIQSVISKMTSVSPYQIRRYLIRANVFGVETLLPISPTTFALGLTATLKKMEIQASINTFFRSNHLDTDNQETYTVDVVCKLKGPNKSKNFKKVIDLSTSVENHIKTYPESCEIIFKGTNVDPDIFRKVVTCR